ncbi:unnamed protein product [Schistocephalus solidus]|uniref:Uncharacterized protein n=1 Tax=Schistocephalus solidus TaxID=70667 RepID=A0A183TSX8_SCHSO|nr:unnamed protein product [Schistocephalus solidus]
MYFLVRTCFLSSSLAQELVGIFFIVKLFRVWYIHNPFVFQYSRQQQINSPSPCQCAFLAAVSTACNLILHGVYGYYSLRMKLRGRRTFDHMTFRSLYLATNYLVLSSIVGCIACWMGCMRWRKSFEQTVGRVIQCTTSGSCSEREDIETPWIGIVGLYEFWRPCVRNFHTRQNFTTDRVNALVRAFKIRRGALLDCMTEVYQLEFVSWMGNYALNSLVCLHFHGTHLVFLGLWRAAALNAQKKRISVTGVNGDAYLNLHSGSSQEYLDSNKSLIEDYVWELFNRLHVQNRESGAMRLNVPEVSKGELRNEQSRDIASWTDISGPYSEEYPRPASTSLISRASTDSEFFRMLHRRSASATGAPTGHF